MQVEGLDMINKKIKNWSNLINIGRNFIFVLSPVSEGRISIFVSCFPF